VEITIRIKAGDEQVDGQLKELAPPIVVLQNVRQVDDPLSKHGIFTETGVIQHFEVQR